MEMKMGGSLGSHQLKQKKKKNEDICFFIFSWEPFFSQIVLFLYPPELDCWHRTCVAHLKAYVWFRFLDLLENRVVGLWLLLLFEVLCLILFSLITWPHMCRLYVCLLKLVLLTKKPVKTLVMEKKKKIHKKKSSVSLLPQGSFKDGTSIPHPPTRSLKWAVSHGLSYVFVWS